MDATNINASGAGSSDGSLNPKKIKVLAQAVRRLLIILEATDPKGELPVMTEVALTTLERQLTAFLHDHRPIVTDHPPDHA